MNRPRFRRHPRPAEVEPEYSRLDRMDGLPGRDYRHLAADELAPAAAWLASHRAEALRASGGLIATGRTVILDAGTRVRPIDPEPSGRTGRYAQCDETCTADCGACKGRRFGPYALAPDGRPGRTRYDAQWPDVLAAEVGGDLAAMAAPADWGEYEIEPESVVVHITADVSRFQEEMARVQADLADAVKPHGRHRQTDPLDLLLADLRDIEDRLS